MGLYPIFDEDIHLITVRCDCEGVYLNIVAQLQYLHNENDIP